MPAQDDNELERRLREHRAEPREEFTTRLASSVDGRRHPSPRPRLTLAFALSLAVLVSLFAFGGVGLASNAMHATKSAVKSATGKQTTSRGGTSAAAKKTAAHRQYHVKVAICYPLRRWSASYVWVTKHKWVWKWDAKQQKKVKVKTEVRIKKLVRTKAVAYIAKTVSDKQVPWLVSRGAVYPVPPNGCWTLTNQPT